MTLKLIGEENNMKKYNYIYKITMVKFILENTENEKQ